MKLTNGHSDVKCKDGNIPLKVQAPPAASSEHGSAHGHPDLNAANGATTVRDAPPETSPAVSNGQSVQYSAPMDANSGHNSAHPNLESKAVGTPTTINATSPESSSPTANASTESDTSERTDEVFEIQRANGVRAKVTHECCDRKLDVSNV
ncbi:hypothetical protein CAEBREN_11081 [Caenorhabditis brenneri]|uniref:Uncharacterized protein n=1 Tax=Caenorhabditis brenneri TaxID=135651 RepID=G0P1W7_CAEBE|nr:hypothetical protein CAEBREN_11081 [Caenorhabditis brenneri]